MALAGIDIFIEDGKEDRMEMHKTGDYVLTLADATTRTVPAQIIYGWPLDNSTERHTFARPRVLLMNDTVNGLGTSEWTSAVTITIPSSPDADAGEVTLKLHTKLPNEDAGFILFETR